MLRVFVDADGCFVRKALARCMADMEEEASAPWPSNDAPPSTTGGAETGSDGDPPARTSRSPEGEGPSLSAIMVERARRIERAGQAAAAHLVTSDDQENDVQEPDPWAPLCEGLWQGSVFAQLLSSVRYKRNPLSIGGFLVEH